MFKVTRPASVSPELDHMCYIAPESLLFAKACLSSQGLPRPLASKLSRCLCRHPRERQMEHLQAPITLFSLSLSKPGDALEGAAHLWEEIKKCSVEDAPWHASQMVGQIQWPRLSSLPSFPWFCSLSLPVTLTWCHTLVSSTNLPECSDVPGIGPRAGSQRVNRRLTHEKFI